jgi:hypothetical protein
MIWLAFVGQGFPMVTERVRPREDQYGNNWLLIR